MMLVLTNRLLGPTAELFVSRDVAKALLAEVAIQARAAAIAHWEHELARWLDEQAVQISSTTSSPHAIDVADIAFTPQHFDRQQRFLIDAIERAQTAASHSRVLAAWAALIEAHPRDSVQVGRRWIWHPTP